MPLPGTALMPHFFLMTTFFIFAILPFRPHTADLALVWTGRF
jgi:hypothetical protein